MSDRYTLGQRLLFSFTTKNTSAALADPTTVTLRVQPPSGALETYTLADTDIVRDSTGTFHMEYLPVAVSNSPYNWAFVTSGNGVDTSTDGMFYVRALRA